jgi:hypothetical protein
MEMNKSFVKDHAYPENLRTDQTIKHCNENIKFI